MVELPCSMSGGMSHGAAAVKLEVADSEEHEPLHKRSRLDGDALAQQDMHCNLLDEPSPLGLRLKKSPSLLDLIQAKLLQEYSASPLCAANNGSSMRPKKKDPKTSAPSGAAERLKASNFSALVLKIGSWEFTAKNDGELVAKCYFAKHKLVWEVLEGGLKSKIEIQWSDISAINANCPEEGVGSLDVVLARPPLFYKETDPQPRKHTLWQATSDFTGGQASMHRRHFLQCHSVLLSKNFEKLVQCDSRLHQLSQEPPIVLQSPFFESRSSMFEDQAETKRSHLFNRVKDESPTAFPGFIFPGSPSLSPVLSENESGGSLALSTEMAQQTATSGPMFLPNQVAGANAAWREEKAAGIIQAVRENNMMASQEFKNTNWLGQLTVPTLRPSTSVVDLVNHWENCISEHKMSGNTTFAGNEAPTKAMLEAAAQFLLSDTQVSSASDEKNLMSRVNSLYCLLQKDPPPPCQDDAAAKSDSFGVNNSPDDSDSEFNSAPPPSDAAAPPANPIARGDSFSDLLMNLPRIASFPFLFGIPENNQK